MINWSLYSDISSTLPSETVHFRINNSLSRKDGRVKIAGRTYNRDVNIVALGDYGFFYNTNKVGSSSQWSSARVEYLDYPRSLVSQCSMCGNIGGERSIKKRHLSTWRPDTKRHYEDLMQVNISACNSCWNKVMPSLRILEMCNVIAVYCRAIMSGEAQCKKLQTYK